MESMVLKTNWPVHVEKQNLLASTCYHLPLAVSNILVWTTVIVLLSLFFLILVASCLSIIDVPNITYKENIHVVSIARYILRHIQIAMKLWVKLYIIPACQYNVNTLCIPIIFRFRNVFILIITYT